MKREGHRLPPRKGVVRVGLTRRPDGSGAGPTEVLYAQMVGYGFARRFVENKTVADIGWEGLGYGSRLLAKSAASVTGLTPHVGYAESASNSYPALNAEYVTADLSELPYPDGHFDVVVALGVDRAEHPEEVLEEARRVLRGEGTLIVSTRDRRISADGSGGMYVSEFRELLAERFGSVGVYGLGAVAGGLVVPLSGETFDLSVEGASLSLTDPRVSPGQPAACWILAVCGEATPTGGADSSEAQEPYLLLDRDRRLLDEAEDMANDVELLREEVRRMQETEVQAFQNSLRLYGTENAYLRAQIRDTRAELHATKTRLQATRVELHAMQSSTTWRIFEPYRRLRARVDAVRARKPEKGN